MKNPEESPKSEAREFWLQDRAHGIEGIHYAKSNQSSFFNLRVIEYSAYTAMKAERDDYKLGASVEARAGDEARAEVHKLKEIVAVLTEALELCAEEMCSHQECFDNMKNKPAMTRDWCRCGQWVYPGQLNPAKAALAIAKEKGMK